MYLMIPQVLSWRCMLWNVVIGMMDIKWSREQIFIQNTKMVTTSCLIIVIVIFNCCTDKSNVFILILGTSKRMRN